MRPCGFLLIIMIICDLIKSTASEKYIATKTKSIIFIFYTDIYLNHLDDYMSCWKGPSLVNQIALVLKKDKSPSSLEAGAIFALSKFLCMGGKDMFFKIQIDAHVFIH